MRKFFTLIFFITTLSLSAQREANFWYFGQNAALDFNSGIPVPTGSASDNQLNTVEGCSTFSDANGNLLFYIGAPSPTATNLTIWNRNNDPMPFSDVDNGGQLLNGDASSSQSALTVPAPGQPNIYYIFTVGAQSSSNAGFWYYTVDMSEDNGLGDVIAGPVALNNGTPLPIWTEKVTAVRGEECNTFWVVSYVNGNFISYKVDNNGVDINNPVISSLGTSSYNFSGVTGGLDPRGYLKVSPDGTKMVAAHMSSGTYFFDFNDLTGVVSNPRELDVEGRNAYGVEFSPSSRRLYISTGNFNASQEFLYQFDLTSNNINTINASRFTVFDYFNTRGALQLGPDNRIYWTSDQSQFISVINRPEELGDAVDYEHQVVDIGQGRLATQGLPPFLSSLLLPIDIIDSQTGSVLNDQTVSFCIGEDKTIIVDDINGTNITYEWTFDDGTGPNIISTTETLVLTNLTTANAGEYSVEIQLTDDCGINTTLSGEFSVEVFESPTANDNLAEILFCDTDNNGFNEFDLPSLKEAEVLDGQDPATFEVTYYATDIDAINDTNRLPTPYTNSSAFSDEVIWVRVQNRNAPRACFDLTSFRLAVTGFPEPTVPEDYVICDNNLDGSDTNGFVDGFVLNTKDNEILGSLDPAQYVVSYHLTADDAENNANPIDKNLPYTNVTVNSQPIFVRVENVDNSECADTSVNFNLVVGELPALENNVINIEECDFDGTLDGVANVNLTQVNSQVSVNAIRFEYFETLADAENGTNAIPNPDSYRNTSSPTNFSYWVRALSEFDCFRISRVDVIVSAVGAFQPANLVPIEACDDFLDVNGNNTANNDDTDGITAFDFSSFIADIRAEFPPNENIVITLYPTQLDADLQTNSIQDITNYRNIGFPNNQIIYVRADNVDQNTCEGVFAYFELFVLPAPTAEDVDDLVLCDDVTDGDFTNGIVQSFDLESQTATILGNQNPADFTVTYHTTRLDAASGVNPIVNTTAYTNTTASQQTIFVRVTNNSTNCFHDRVSFDLIVNPLPVVGTITPLEICDDDSDGSAQNGFSQIIDLESKTPEILNGQDPNNFTVTYHISLADAQSGNQPLSSPFTNTLAGTQTIYIRVVNQTTGCANDFFSFNIVVQPEPTNEIIAPLELCDNSNDGDDTNGFVQSFDLQSVIPNLLGPSQNPADFIVSFHEIQADAELGSNPLSTPYANTTANRQTIFARIENRITGCVNDQATFEIVVNPLPEFELTSPQIYCLNTSGLDLTPENPSATYDYFWTNDQTGDITNGELLTVTSAGSYTLTATTIDGTGCSRSRSVVVNESNIATLENSFVTVYDESNNNGIDRQIFVEIDTENNDLGPGDYQFALLNTETGTRVPIAGFQDEPRFDNLEGGVYQVIVNDKNGCAPDATLTISVIQFPKFFTPNGDGINETWSIRGLTSSFYPTGNVRIFNRFGKVITTLQVDGPGWDGTFNGTLMPSDDYWFSVQLTDTNGNVRERRGNFALIRAQR